MTELRELELISAAIDGDLDFDERIELDLLLESSAEAREFKAELEQLGSLLSDIPDLEPPESVHAHIMAHAKPHRAPGKPSIMDWLHDLEPGAGLRYALAAAAGALVVTILFGGQSTLTGTNDFMDLVGTMAPDSDSANADIIDSFEFRDDRIEALVQLRLSAGVLLLDIHADTTESLDISVDLSSSGLWPDALVQLDGRSESIGIAGQALQIRALGKQRLTILLRRADDTRVNNTRVNYTAFAGKAEITLEFSSEGNLLQRGSLSATLEGVGQ